MQRTVVDEILDGLPPDDPDAIGSRRDLRRINFIMGNFRWMRRKLRNLAENQKKHLVELGAGDGGFLGEACLELERSTGLDLAPRPDGLPEKVAWETGNAFEKLDELSGPGSVLAANLFLHHFEDSELRELGVKMRRFPVLCFSEPWRSRLALAEGYLLCPFVNRVTRHDMVVSIRAGFKRGEMPVLLGLGDDWEIREEVSLLGACRLLAWRR